MHKIDFRKWQTYLFLALVEEDEKHGGAEYFELSELADQLGYEYPQGWVAKAADVWRHKGWIVVDHMVADSPDEEILAKLTGRGYDAYSSGKWGRPIDRSQVTPVRQGRQVPTPGQPAKVTPPVGAVSVSMPQPGIVTTTSPRPSDKQTNPAQAVQVNPTIYSTGSNAQITVMQVNSLTIDHKDPGFMELKERVSELVEAIRGSNEISPEAKEQMLSEIQAGAALMEAPKVERNWIDLFVYRPAKYLAKQFANSVVGKIAGAVVTLAAKCLGWSL